MASNLATMSIISLVLLYALLQGASATSFNVVNNCGGTTNVRWTEDWDRRIRSRASPVPASQSIGYAQTPSLLAEFTINQQPGLDHYDVSAVDGFQLDRGMRILGGNPTVTCRASSPRENIRGSACMNPNKNDGNTNYANSVRRGCPDAYSWSGDNTKDHGTGTFTITFCP